MNDEFIRKNINEELTRQGFSCGIAESCANKGVEHYRKTAKFQGGAYMECCNYAGLLAAQMAVGVKYKPVKPRGQARSKRPPEAWDF